MNNDTTDNHRDAENVWTYRRANSEWFIINKPDGSVFAYFQFEDVCKEICDRFNELDRLRSSMGKVPSDEEIERCIKEIEDNSEYRGKWDISDLRTIAKWMRSEVAPVIARLEMHNRLMIEAEKGAVGKIDSLRSELKQAKDALGELSKEAEDLMDLCIDRKYLDNEDKTDGQILFDTALNKAKKLLTPKK